jgi:hypothetical protein
MRIEQAEGQDRNVFNNAKRFIRDLSKLDNKQLAIVNFEIWHEAKTRGARLLEEEKKD